MNIDTALYRRIEAAGQLEVLRFWNDIDEAGQRKLAAQLAAINWEELPGLIRDYVLQRPKTEIPDDLAPAKYFPDRAGDAETADLYRRAVAAGENALRQGRVCCLTVAGGQGTRLGFDGPKGTYPIGPVSGRSLFAYFAGSILRAGQKYGRPISWYIMTSLLNCDATIDFFRRKGRCRQSVMMASCCWAHGIRWLCRPTVTAGRCWRCANPVRSSAWNRKRPI